MAKTFNLNKVSSGRTFEEVKKRSLEKAGSKKSALPIYENIKKPFLSKPVPRSQVLKVIENESAKNNIENLKLDLFQSEPYNLNLKYEDIFGMLAYLDEKSGYALFGLDPIEDMALVDTFVKACPNLINNDKDIIHWMQEIEKIHPWPIMDENKTLSIGFEPYSESLIDIKKSINEAFQNHRTNDFISSESYDLAGFNALNEVFSDERIALLSENKIKKAYELRDQIRLAMHKLEDIFAAQKHNL